MTVEGIHAEGTTLRRGKQLSSPVMAHIYGATCDLCRIAVDPWPDSDQALDALRGAHPDPDEHPSLLDYPCFIHWEIVEVDTSWKLGSDVIPERRWWPGRDLLTLP